MLLVAFDVLVVDGLPAVASTPDVAAIPAIAGASSVPDVLTVATLLLLRFPCMILE